MRFELLKVKSRRILWVQGSISWPSFACETIEKTYSSLTIPNNKRAFNKTRQNKKFIFSRWSLLNLTLCVGGGLCSSRKSFLLPTLQPRVRIPAQPKISVYKQYWDWTHLVLRNGFHKCSVRWRPELSTESCWYYDYLQMQPKNLFLNQKVCLQRLETWCKFFHNFAVLRCWSLLVKQMDSYSTGCTDLITGDWNSGHSSCC